MSRITLWLGQKLGNLLTALFISAVAYCLPALLSLSGMKAITDRKSTRLGIETQPLDTIFHSGKAQQRGQAIGNCTDKERGQQIPQFLSKP